MLTYVSVVDSFLIGGIYLFVAVLWKDLFWFRAMDKKHIWTACVSSFALAAFIAAPCHELAGILADTEVPVSEEEIIHIIMHKPGYHRRGQCAKTAEGRTLRRIRG